VALDDANKEGLSKKLKKAQIFQNIFVFMHVPLV